MARGALVRLCVLAAAAAAAVWPADPSFRLGGHLTSEHLLNFAVESRVYPSHLDLAFVTCRGGGMTVLNISSSPVVPTHRWETQLAVEGQDMRLADGVIVVAELGLDPGHHFPSSRGPHLHLFSPLAQQSEPPGAGLQPLEPFASLNLSASIDAILHCKFLTQDTWVICSGGAATTVRGAVIAIDVRPYASRGRYLPSKGAPPRAFVLSTPVDGPEGVLVLPSGTGGSGSSGAGRSVVYVGGFYSTQLAVVDVTDPTAMRVLQVISGAGSQMVGATAMVGGSLFAFLADWGNIGGLVIANATVPDKPVLVPGPATSSALGKANRVHLSGGLAFLPLEQSPVGGFAVIDVTVPESSKVLDVLALPPVQRCNNTKAYCLCAHEGTQRAFVFAAESSTMFVFNTGP